MKGNTARLTRRAYVALDLSLPGSTLGRMEEMVGRVLGTVDATPLEFWVGVAEGEYLELDDVVALERVLPTGELVKIFGTISQVRARHEGARFDSDVFLIEDGVLPAEVMEAAQVTATRVEPEIFVPPRPGQPVRRAHGKERDQALFFDRMDRRFPVGASRDGEPLFANFEFINGQRGAHVNISGVSGVATKTSYATFLLHSLFTSGVLGAAVVNTRALIFNVKGEDLLHLDRRNTSLDEDAERLLSGAGATGPAVRLGRSVRPAAARIRSGGGRCEQPLRPDVVLLDAGRVLPRGLDGLPVRRRRG